MLITQRFPKLIGQARAITLSAPLTSPRLCRNHPPRCGKVRARGPDSFVARFMAGGRSSDSGQIGGISA